MFAFSRQHFTEDCATGTHTDVEPTLLRLDRTYIIVYVNWVWCITTGILPFFALLLLNCKIFPGLKKVQKNLNRHQRLAKREEELEKEQEAAERSKVGGSNGNGNAGNALSRRNGSNTEITFADDVTVAVDAANGEYFFAFGNWFCMCPSLLSVRCPYLK